MKRELVAPCGMNCNVCSSYLALSSGLPKKKGEINHCEGCLPRGKKCAYLKGHCNKIADGKLRFCSGCPSFPCERLKTIDARYRRSYDASLIDNLREIEKTGIDGFLRKQRNIFKCAKCGGTVSVHNRKCYSCDKIESWRE